MSSHNKNRRVVAFLLSCLPACTIGLGLVGAGAGAAVSSQDDDEGLAIGVGAAIGAIVGLVIDATFLERLKKGPATVSGDGVHNH